MRIQLIAAGVLASTLTSYAADCSSMSAEIVQIASWSAKNAEYGQVQVDLDLENTSGKDFRMIKGAARFYDPFDDHIISLELVPDVRVSAGETFSQRGLYHAARLAKINPDDVTAIACIEGVVYSDGSKQEFK